MTHMTRTRRMCQRRRTLYVNQFLPGVVTQVVLVFGYVGSEPLVPGSMGTETTVPEPTFQATN